MLWRNSLSVTGQHQFVFYDNKFKAFTLFKQVDLPFWRFPNSRYCRSIRRLVNRPFSLGRFVVPLQITWYSLENCSFIHLKLVYSCTRNYLKIWKEEFSRVSSRGLKWGNKPPSRKRSIRLRFAGLRKLAKVSWCDEIFATNGHMSLKVSRVG